MTTQVVILRVARSSALSLARLKKCQDGIFQRTDRLVLLRQPSF